MDERFIDWFNEEKKRYLQNGNDKVFINKIEEVLGVLENRKQAADIGSFLKETISYKIPFGGPLTGEDDEWEDFCKHKMNKRYPSLFKMEDGSFYDKNRAICFNVRTNEIYQGEIEQTIFNEFFPIEFPYIPVHHGYKIFTLNYGDKIVSVRYIKCPDGDVKEIGKFLLFKNDMWIEVNEKTWLEEARLWDKGNRVSKKGKSK